MTTEAVTEILQRLSRIEAQLAERCAARGADIVTLEKSQKRQGERIGALEAAEEKRKGASAVLMAMAGSVGALAGAIGAYLSRQ